MPKPITAMLTGSKAGILNIENAPGILGALNVELILHSCAFAETPPQASFNAWLIMRPIKSVIP